jgi:hypothetical protein
MDDGLPETLEEWIERDGLVNFKIKLNGGDMTADLDRILRIDRIVSRALPGKGVDDWRYLLDFNEGCPNVEYLLECLARVREATPLGFDRILYIEQPTRAICRPIAATSCTRRRSCGRSSPTSR